jgi:hypothetical protein
MVNIRANFETDEKAKKLFYEMVSPNPIICGVCKEKINLLDPFLTYMPQKHIHTRICKKCRDGRLESFCVSWLKGVKESFLRNKPPRYY